MKFQWCPTGCEGGSGIGRTQWRSYLRGKSWGLPCLWGHHCQGEVRWEFGMWKWSSNDNNFYFSPIPCIKEPFWPLDFFFCHINLVKGEKIFTTITKSLQSFQHLLLVCFSSHNKMPYTGGLKNRHLFLIFPEVGKSKIKGVRVLFLACRHPLSCRIFTWQTELARSLVSFISH